MPLSYILSPMGTFWMVYIFIYLDSIRNEDLRSNFSGSYEEVMRDKIQDWPKEESLNNNFEDSV